MLINQVMNTIDPHCIEELRKVAILESRSRNRDPNDPENQIILIPEFENIFNDNIFPLGKHDLTF
jgi:hypothetical protein